MLCKPVELWRQEPWRGSSGVQAAASPQHPSRCCSGDRSCTFLSSNLLFVHNCRHTFSSLLRLPNSPHPQQMPPASIELLLLCFLTHGFGPKAFILSIPLSLRENSGLPSTPVHWLEFWIPSRLTFSEHQFIHGASDARGGILSYVFLFPFGLQLCLTVF